MNDMFWDRSARKNITRRMHTASRNRSVHLPKALRFLIILIGLVLILGIFLQLTRIRSVLCTDDGNPCDQPDELESQTLQGRLMVLPLSISFPGKKVQITKKYPSTVRIELTTQETVAYVYTALDASSAVAIRTDRTIGIAKPEEASNSAIITDLTLQVGTKELEVSQESLVAYTLLLDFAKVHHVQSIVIQSSQEIHILLDQIEAVVSRSELEKQLRSLQEILASPTIEGKPARVDLRFAHPIVEYK